MINHVEKTIPNTAITIETARALYIIPIISIDNDMTTDIIEYALERYNHPNGSKCAPKIIAKTMTIFSGTVGYIHIAIKIYRN